MSFYRGLGCISYLADKSPLIMKIPYVIDNQSHKLADVLNELLAHYTHRSLDVASAFFSVNGFELVREGLDKPRQFPVAAWP